MTHENAPGHKALSPRLDAFLALWWGFWLTVGLLALASCVMSPNLRTSIDPTDPEWDVLCADSVFAQLDTLRYSCFGKTEVTITIPNPFYRPPDSIG